MEKVQALITKSSNIDITALSSILQCRKTSWWFNGWYIVIYLSMNSENRR